MTTYLPGSFFVVDVPGPGGWWIGVAQALAGDASRYKHAGLILDANGTILEAEPGGARIGNISEYAGDGLLIGDPVRISAVNSWWGQNIDAEEAKQRQHVVATARGLGPHDGKPGVGYSWLDYAAIAALHLHLPSAALRRYVASSGHAQCAQLVDLAYMRAGVHLFADGRQPGDVCPADLAAWAEDHGAVA